MREAAITMSGHPVCDAIALRDHRHTADARSIACGRWLRHHGVTCGAIPAPA